MPSHRGRSPVVSPVALARQKSEERTRADLADQLQVAYALDNLRLAKILLLRLNGVHVLHDADPRIDRVRDEDFDVCFAPSGPLTLDDADTRAVQDSRRRQWRDARLRACEKRWGRPTKSRDPFQYCFIQPAKSHRSVAFKEVIDAMNGQLFPLDPRERADDARRIAGLPIANTPPHKRKASVRAELLDSLVGWQHDAVRTAKGKDVHRSHTPPPPPPTPPLSTPGSWLSFGSWRSTATDITTPDSPSPTSHPCLLPTLVDTQPDNHPRSAFVRISLEESPLCQTASYAPLHDDHPCATPPAASSLGIRGALTRSVATIVEAAKGLQSAYIAATMFAAGSPYQVSDTQPPRPSQLQVRPEGYRALAKDVRKFTHQSTPITQTCSEPVHFIPLASPPSGNPVIPNPPVPKGTVVFPSPLRPRTPPVALAYRMRPVANPAVLRLRALENIMYARGKQWEGRARDGALGCGKERMLGIAFEGRGRSGLGCELRFVVA